MKPRSSLFYYLRVTFTMGRPTRKSARLSTARAHESTNGHMNLCLTGSPECVFRSTQTRVASLLDTAGQAIENVSGRPNRVTNIRGSGCARLQEKLHNKKNNRTLVPGIVGLRYWRCNGDDWLC